MITETSSTLTDIKNALERICPGGVISITCYPGHPEGKREEEALLSFLSSLDPKFWSFTSTSWNNRNASPSLLLIQKSYFWVGVLLSPVHTSKISSAAYTCIISLTTGTTFRYPLFSSCLVFSLTLTTLALYQRSLRWFEPMLISSARRIFLHLLYSSLDELIARQACVSHNFHRAATPWTTEP